MTDTTFVSDGAGGPAIAAAFDLAAPPDDYFDDPDRYFRLLRRFEPIHAMPGGAVLLTRYEDNRTVWRDLSASVDKYELFRSRFGDGPLLEYHGTNMLFSDSPDHDRLRALLNPFFSTRNMERLSGMIAAQVDLLLDRCAAKGEVEFVGDFALRLPTNVISLIIGLPVEDGPYLHELSERVVNPLNPNHPAEEMERAHAATAEFAGYVRERLERERAKGDIDPAASVLSALTAAERDGGRISETEIIHSCMLTFIGGHSTTTNLISASIHHLIANPDQLAELRGDPAIMDGAIEELIRYISPTQLQGRRTTRPISVASGEIAAGTEVVLCPASANRDESVFDEPGRLNLRRAPNPHIAFGAGVHFCIGRMLARQELRATLSAMLRRFATIERAGPSRFRRLPRFRSLETLPLRLA